MERMDRRIAVPEIIGNPDDFLIISGLAGPGKDVGALTKESSNVFILGGAMGGATMVGLGVALARPDKRVLVVTGDGEMLMGVGSLAVVAAMRPANLAILCVDNGVHGETGGQATHTSLATDLAAMAQGSGIPATRTVTTEDEIDDGARILRDSNGPAFVVLKVDQGPPPSYSRNWDAVARKLVFRDALKAPQ